MRIKNLKVKNFKSLLDVEVGPLGDLVVVIGENDSGKSNLLEAIQAFFTWFPAQQDFQQGGKFQSLWHYDVEPSEENPIEISIDIDLELPELNLLPPD